VCYLAAGIAVTWPRAAYLTGRLPGVDDVSSYDWDLWWVAHQVSHLGNPWFTGHMAAPAGIQLGFDTTMPLVGLVMTPVTLASGPTAALELLTALTPGLACYAMYRAARLWLRSQTGAIAAGAFFGLATMLTFQDWYHVNIAIGAVSLPLALEAAVRLRRHAGLRPGLVLGAVLGAAVLVNLETAVMAALSPRWRWCPGYCAGRRQPASWRSRSACWPGC
jgi:dolichyl-phosphate beta-glucosyltransferase